MATVTLYLYQDDGTSVKTYSNAKKGNGLTSNAKSTYISKAEEKLSKEVETKGTDGSTIHELIYNKTFYSFSLTLSKLSYKKKVYRHGEILAEVQVGKVQKYVNKVTKTVITDQSGNETPQDDKEVVDENPVDVELPGDAISKYFKGAWACLEINSNKVAENYKVFKVLTRYKTVSNSTSKFLELTINSADKLLDLDKYSRAYTARRLYTDILTKESEKFFLQKLNLEELSNYKTQYQDYLAKKNDSTSTNDNDNKAPTWSSPLYVDDKTMNLLIAENLQLLKYKRKETEGKETKEVSDELRIPYLVQYNETFYHFLKRVTNRLGEFLYFEDGRLNLGIKLSENNYFEKDSKGNLVEKDGANVILDWANATSGIQSRYYENGFYEGIDVEDRAYNYINHTKNDDNSQLYAASADSRYNPDPVAVDEWTEQELEAGKYLEYGEVLGEEMKGFVVEVVFKALEASTFSDFLANVLKGFVMKLIEVGQSTNDLDRVMDLAFYQDKKGNYLIPVDQRNDAEKAYSQFVTYGKIEGIQNLLKDLLGEDCKVGNLNDLFYSLIRKKEKEITEQIVWLDFGSNYKPIKLGDKLRVDGKDYVAISVKGSYEYVDKATSEGKTTPEAQESLLVSALPLLNMSSVSVLPPTIPDAIIREAKPQVAFVADSLDPENLGRIRVRYPWQDSDGDASPWIRVTLPLATKGGAVNFTPSEGDEVMVGYVHGNIDHPYAMGYLASKFVNKKWSNAMPLDQYGGVHGIKTKTGHHLTFSDGFALFPMMMSTLGCLSFLKSVWPTGQIGPWPLGWEQTADFGGGFELSDRYGFYKIKGSTDERSVTIESPAGTVNVNAFQGITISAPNGEVNIKGKNVNISASNKLNLISGENIKDKLWYQEDWDKNFMGKVKSLGNVALADLKGGAAAVGEIAENIADLSFIRCVVELLFRPVNGTLSIKSYTFVTVEAGDGKINVPQESLRDTESPSLVYVQDTVELINMNVTALFDNIQNNYTVFYNALQTFNQISNAQGYNKNGSAITYNAIVSGDAILEDKDYTWQDGANDGNDLKLENPGDFTKEEPQQGQDNYQVEHERWENERRENEAAKARDLQRINKQDRIKMVSQNLRNAAKNLKAAASKWTDFSDKEFNSLNLNKKKVKVSDAVKSIKKEKLGLNGLPELAKMKDCSFDHNTLQHPDQIVWDNQKKSAIRKAVYHYLSEAKELKSGSIENDDVMGAGKWTTFADSLKANDSVSLSLKQEFKDWAKELIPGHGWVDDQKQWAFGYKGKILMSDMSSKTSSFDNNHNLTAKDNRDEAGVDKIIESIKKL